MCVRFVVKRLCVYQRLYEFVGQLLDPERDLHLDRAAARAFMALRVVDELAFLAAGAARCSHHLSKPSNNGLRSICIVVSV